MTFEEALAKSEEEHRRAAGGGRGAAGDIGIMLGIDIAIGAFKRYLIEIQSDPEALDPEYPGYMVVMEIETYKPKVVTP